MSQNYLKRNAGKSKSDAYIDSDDVDAFMNEIKGHRLEIPFIFALYYGLRRSEICGLRWSVIHDDGYMHIEHTVTRVKTMVAKDAT